MTLFEIAETAKTDQRFHRPNWDRAYYWWFNKEGKLCEHIGDESMVYRGYFIRHDITATDYEFIP